MSVTPACAFIAPTFSVAATATAAPTYYFNADGSCLGIAGYVNGSNCAGWPVQQGAPASVYYTAENGNITSASCQLPTYATQYFAEPISSTVACNLPNAAFTAIGNVTYRFPIDAVGGSSSIVFDVAPPPNSTITITAVTPFVTTITVLGTPTIVTEIYTTTVEGQTTIDSTVYTTVGTTQVITVVDGVTTIFVPATPAALLRERQITCIPEGPAGSYYANASDTATSNSPIQTVTQYPFSNTTTFSRNIPYIAFGATTRTNTSTNLVYQTDFQTVTVETTIPSVATVVTSSTSSPTQEPPSVTGPFWIVATPSAVQFKKRAPKEPSRPQKRQDLTPGYVGLGFSNGTAGLYTSPENALPFWIYDGRLVTNFNGLNWYTYTELTTIADPSFETWVFQQTPPSADSISTEFNNGDTGTELNWVNDAFIAEPSALPVALSPYPGNLDARPIQWYYDISLIQEGQVILILDTASITPLPSATSTLTAIVTITEIATVLAEPTTTFVCPGGASTCPSVCPTNAIGLLTTSVCTTNSDGLATCAQCLATQGMVVETVLDIVTDVVPCTEDICPPVPAPTPCDDEIIYITVNGGEGQIVTVTPEANPENGGNANVVVVDADAGSETPTPSTPTPTRQTPTATPSVGLGRRVDVESRSVTALVIVAGVFAFFG